MKKAMIVLALGLASVPAFAAETGGFYDSVGLDYIYHNVDGSSVDGFGLGFSRSINDNFFTQLGYSRVSESGANVQGLSAELGYAYGLTVQTDFVVTAGVSYDKLSGAGQWNTSDTGFISSVGFRSHVTDSIDVAGAVLYSRVDSSSDTAYNIGARWHFSSTLSLGLGYTYVDSDASTISAGIAYHF